MCKIFASLCLTILTYSTHKASPSFAMLCCMVLCVCACVCLSVYLCKKGRRKKRKRRSRRRWWWRQMRRCLPLLSPPQRSLLHPISLLSQVRLSRAFSISFACLTMWPAASVATAAAAASSRVTEICHSCLMLQHECVTSSLIFSCAFSDQTNSNCQSNTGPARSQPDVNW